MIEILKKLIDSAQYTSWPSELSAKYEALKIKPSNFMTEQVINKTLYERIFNAATNTGELSEKVHVHKLDKLSSELCYRAILEGENVEEYLKVINVIKDALPHKVKYISAISDNQNWLNIIIDCLRCIKNSPNGYGLIFGDLRETYPREYDVAKAVAALSQKGCKYKYVDGRLEITSGFENVISELEVMIERIGGANLMNILFQNLAISGQYSNRYERFHIYQTASTLASDQNSQVPYGYLLNLCLKYPSYRVPATFQNYEDSPNAIINLASIIVQANYDIQAYNRWDLILVDGSTLLAQFQKIVLWDNVFSISQGRPTLCIEVTGELFNCIEDRVFKNKVKFSKTLFLKVCKLIDDQCQDAFGPVVVLVSTVMECFDTAEHDEVRIVLRTLGHKNSCNKDFRIPINASSNDYFLKPFILMEEERLFVPQRSWAAPNYFEALVSIYREFDKDLDSKIGLEFENLLAKRLEKKGFNVVSGNYKVRKVEGESDLLVITNKAIIIIECKKKNLTRSSKSGTIQELLLNLSDSLFSAHLQTGKVEILLRENGSLTINHKGLPVEVRLENREIIRVALTLSDYGGFHDRQNMQNFLQAMITHSFSSNSEDGKIQKKFSELENKRKKWMDQVTNLKKLDVYTDTYPFKEAMFMNLMQFLEVMNESSGEDSFIEALLQNRHITYGTGDFYKERELLKFMKMA